MTSADRSHSGAGSPGGSNQGNPPVEPYHIDIHEQRLIAETEDNSKDRNTDRTIKELDAAAHRSAKLWLIRSTIVIAFSISVLGAYIVFNHKDAKMRELGISLISAPIAGLFGVIAGMAFK